MECYICYEKESSFDKFVKDPCRCKGSNKIHISCLKKLVEKNGSTCSICKQEFSLGSTNKNYTVDSYGWHDERIPEQITENYLFAEDDRKYRYESKKMTINYTYVGNGNYRFDYKYKDTCAIS